jgi:hypothetical protein
MPVPFRTYGEGLLVIDGDSVRGESADSGSGQAGSDLTLSGGVGDGAGRGGDVVVSPGPSGAGSANKGLVLLATENDASGSDTGGVVIYTQSGSFAGSGWHHRTYVVDVPADASGTPVDLFIVPGPGASGENVKVRAWVTVHVAASIPTAMTKIVEASFTRSGSSLFKIGGDLTDQREVLGATSADMVLAVSSTDVAIQCTPDALQASNWSFLIEWQRGNTAP